MRSIHLHTTNSYRPPVVLYIIPLVYLSQSKIVYTMTWTNLHEACENGQPDDVVKEAHDHPECILDVEDHGWTPLHCAVWRNPNLAAITSLIEASPEAASIKDVHGNTPLHVAVSLQGINKDIVQKLVDVYPDAASSVNREGLMPLHMVLRFAPRNQDVIRLLVDTYSQALNTCIKVGIAM
jgi:ankyrin repeat protein